MSNVYHSSKISGLKVLEPKISTHKKPWVYATKDIATAAMFLGDNFDFICQTGLEPIPFIWERFEGAFDLAYRNKAGSIYILDGTNFKEDQTSWSGDLVSEQEEKVKKEIVVDNVEEFLKKLAKEKKLNIYFYPDQPEDTPTDKSDIIERAVDWTINLGEETLDEVKKYHPDVLEKVLKQLHDKGYKFKSKLTGN